MYYKHTFNLVSTPSYAVKFKSLKKKKIHCFVFLEKSKGNKYFCNYPLELFKKQDPSYFSSFAKFGHPSGESFSSFLIWTKGPIWEVQLAFQPATGARRRPSSTIPANSGGGGAHSKGNFPLPSSGPQFC